MDDDSYEDDYDVDTVSRFFAGLMLLTGLLLGSLVSVTATLLLAPQSGKKTRRQIQQKGKKLRKQTAKAVDEGVNQVRAKAQQVSTGIQEQAEALQQRGVDAVDQQKERWSPVVEAGKTAVNGS